MKKIQLFSLWYFFSILLLFFYSYTQVDLSLTLSRIFIYQSVEKSFQYVGYFQRPFSTFLYSGILLILIVNYALLLFFIQKKLIKKKQLWFLIITVSIILAFSYNSFSYDFFNYIFDAKIFTHYHLSPYFFKALDFPKDPMLSFMHWTHRTYPYGPTWIFLSILLSYLGFGYFLLTFFIFKLFIAACFLGSVFYIGKILQRTDPKNELFGLAFFAFNPLVIIESLVSAHNDIVMMFFALLSIYLIVKKQTVLSLLSLIFSIAIKFAIAFIIPFYFIFIFYTWKKKNILWQPIFIGICAIMSGAVVVASVRTNFEPWYLLYFLPFAALISKKYYIFIPAVICSLLSLLTYVPFLYLGNWDQPVPRILTQLHIGFIFLSILAVFIAFLTQRVLLIKSQKKLDKK